VGQKESKVAVVVVVEKEKDCRGGGGAQGEETARLVHYRRKRISDAL
jgi:hypothetical protein